MGDAGPTGAQGPTGDTGATGPTGTLADTAVVVGTPSTGTVGTDTVSGVSVATCADGSVVISGNTTAALQFSMPDPNSGSNPNGWQAQAVVIGGAGGDTFTVTAYAICSGSAPA
jgi:hypothetical protein